jgi:hypothetical protein
MRLEVRMAIKESVLVLWVVTPCGLVGASTLTFGGMFLGLTT